LQYADFVFCNEDEAQIFADVNKIEHSSLADVAVALAKWNKINTKRPRVAIITQGKNPTLVATS
jgi:adenosine kinase